MTKYVVFADLDGTLLDDDYCYTDTKPIVDQLTSLGCSIVYCSSKTKTEIEHYRTATGNSEPFISENGGAIFIPKNYFTFRFGCKDTSNYHVIRLAASYRTLRTKLRLIKDRTAAQIVGFGDMTLAELSYDTGLPLDLAKLAKKREHGEPFRILEGNRMHILSAIKQEGLYLTRGGRYFHLTDGCDKGKAVKVLKTLYSEMFGKVLTYAVGDGPNDYQMLKAVDKPFMIKKSPTSRLNAWSGILSHLTSTICP